MRMFSPSEITRWLRGPGQLIKVIIQARKTKYSGNLDEGEDWTTEELAPKEIVLKVDGVYCFKGKLKYLSGVVLLEDIVFEPKNPEVLVPFYGNYYYQVTPAWLAYRINARIEKLINEAGQAFQIDPSQFPIEECYLSHQKGLIYDENLRAIITTPQPYPHTDRTRLLEGCESMFNKKTTGKTSGNDITAE